MSYLPTVFLFLHAEFASPSLHRWPSSDLLPLKRDSIKYIAFRGQALITKTPMCSAFLSAACLGELTVSSAASQAN
jgi:hypothetical protein